MNLSSLDYMECKDQKKLVSEATRQMQMILQGFKLGLSAKLDPEIREKIESLADDMEGEFIALVHDEVESEIEGRLDEIREEESCEDYRAESRHMTATYPNTRASL